MTLAGILTLMLGNHAWYAFDVLGVASWCSTYGGMFWIGRLCGLSRTHAHFPAICVVTSAYWITDAYGRGDWAEFIAISSIPLVIASSAAILRNGRLTLWPTVAFLTSFWIFTGSHNITLFWGALLALLVLAVLVLFGVRAALRPSVLARLASLGLLVVAMNSWYLVPDLLYSSSIQISHYPVTKALAFNSPANLFDPLRNVPKSSTSSALFVQLPVIFLIVAAAELTCLILRVPCRRLKVAFALGTVFVFLTGAVVYAVPTSLPRPFSSIQFSYRLVSYISLIVGFLVLAAINAGRRRFRSRHHQDLFFGALFVASVAGMAIAIWQLWIPKTVTLSSLANRVDAVQSIARAPKSFYGYRDYEDASQAVAGETSASLSLVLPSNMASGTIRVTTPSYPPGSLVQTNVAGGPAFVKIGGDFRRAGRNSFGDSVIRTLPRSGRRSTLTLSAATTPLFVFVRWVSVLTTMVGLALVLGLVGRTLFRRQSPYCDQVTRLAFLSSALRTRTLERRHTPAQKE
jgi:hypothetical protein